MGPLGPCLSRSGSRYSMSMTCGPRDIISQLSLEVGITCLSIDCRLPPYLLLEPPSKITYMTPFPKQSKALISLLSTTPNHLNSILISPSIFMMLSFLVLPLSTAHIKLNNPQGSPPWLGFHLPQPKVQRRVGEVTVGLDLGLCLQGHTKWVGDFSTLVGVYKDGKKPNQVCSLHND